MIHLVDAAGSQPLRLIGREQAQAGADFEVVPRFDFGNELFHRLNFPLARPAGESASGKQRLETEPGIEVRMTTARQPAGGENRTVLVVLGVITFDRLHIDDPVGATSVHLLNGVFGTLCVGLFAEKEILASRALTSEGGLFFGGGTAQLVAQITGIVATAIYVLVASSICWAILKFTVGIRVSREEEIEGLDLGEHGNEAYHGFAMVATPEG